VGSPSSPKGKTKLSKFCWTKWLKRLLENKALRMLGLSA
jgi:hypothetical protein